MFEEFSGNGVKVYLIIWLKPIICWQLCKPLAKASGN
jgi:hypothetical protein